MKATDLIEFVELQDDRGRTLAHFYPSENVIKIKAGKHRLSFMLSDANRRIERQLPIKARVEPIANCREV